MESCAGLTDYQAEDVSLRYAFWGAPQSYSRVKSIQHIMRKSCVELGKLAQIFNTNIDKQTDKSKAKTW